MMILWQVVREVEQSRNGVRVMTEDGRVYSANYLILSVSIGVLQSDLISFNPPFPVSHSLNILQHSQHGFSFSDPKDQYIYTYI